MFLRYLLFQRPIDDGAGEREGVQGLGKVFFFIFVM